MSRQTTFFYGWIVLAACFVATFSFGLLYTFAVFMPSLVKEFDWSRALTSSVYSVQYGAWAVSSVIVGRLTDRLSARPLLLLGALFIGTGMALCSQVNSLWQLYLLYTITGLGLGATWVIPAVIVQRWFIRNRGFALGIVAAGVGVGALILVPMVTYLSNSFSWRIAYLVVGISLGILLILTALVIRDAPEKMGLRPYGEEKVISNIHTSLPLDDRRVIRSRSYIFVIIMYALNMFAWTIINVHLVSYASELGMGSMAGSQALGILAGVSVAGRIVIGTLADKFGWKEADFITCLLCGLLVASLLWVTNPQLLILFAVVYGFFYGGRIPTMTGLVAYLFGIRGLAELTGIAWGLGGLFGLLGPITAGYLFDRLDSYTVAFIVSAFAFVLAGCFSLLTRRRLETVRTSTEPVSK